MHGEGKNSCRILVSTAEGKRPLESARHRHEVNIKVHFIVIWNEDAD
jgi:hypothetical protein